MFERFKRKKVEPKDIDETLNALEEKAKDSKTEDYSYSRTKFDLIASERLKTAGTLAETREALKDILRDERTLDASKKNLDKNFKKLWR